MFKADKATLAPLAAEFLGTGFLVLIALVLSETTAVSYFIATSVAVALGVAYMVFANVSGGHFNPAITIGMWTARKVGTVKGVSYVVAQLLGGLASWKLYEYFINHSLPAKAAHYDSRIFIAEAVGALILSLGFAAAVSRGLTALESALTYGASLFVGVLVAATAAAGYLNPAIALGLRSFDWTYALGPVVGAIVGINLYYLLFAPTKAKK